MTIQYRPNDDFNRMGEIFKLDIKKGDVLLIKVDDSNPKDLPRDILNKLIVKHCEATRKAFHDVFGTQIELIFIPKSMDVSVLRLEEWFV